MMLVYWIQSMVIGAANVFRILNLDRFDPSNFKIDGKEVDETPTTKRKVAFGFLVHYGFFHVLYLLFVTTGARDAELGSLRGYLLCALVFAVNHGYSLMHNLRRDAAGRPSIGALMFMPYVRIVPMHLTILFGGLFFGGAFALFLFGLLKTAADGVMHVLEHHLFQHPESLHAQARSQS